MSGKRSGGTSDGRLAEFREYRERMNERILGAGHLGVKRFFNLDSAAYDDGALYVGARMYDSLGAAGVSRQLTRRVRLPR